MLNARLVPDAQAVLTPGEAVAGMLLNGVGVAHRPLSLTPQWCANKPLARWFREGLEAERCNRCQRGRPRDDASTYGGDVLLQELARAVCAHDGSDQRFNPLDPTSCSLTGESVPDSDAPAMTSPHGSSNDHRPDRKQAGLERMVAHDGGVPCVSQRWDGHTLDIQVFQERAQAVRPPFEPMPSPRDLVADATLSHADKAPHRKTLGVITRLPNTLGVVSPGIRHARTGDTWHPVDDTIRAQRLEGCHDGMAQRGPYHQVESSHRTEHPRDAGKGRPTPRTPRKASPWPIQAHVRPADEAMRHPQHVPAGGVLGTTISPSALSAPEVSAAYKSPARVEAGCRLLKDPRFVVSSLLVNQPRRIAGLWLVMTLAWLVYAVTQRRRRQPCAPPPQTGPHHIHQPTTSPTVRWGCPV